MRRLGSLCLFAVLLAGCGEEPAAPAKQLAAWRISDEVFIPRVEPVKAPARPKAPAPAKVQPAAPADQLDSGAPSDAEVRRQLRQLYGEAGGDDPGSARTLSLSGGLASAPPDAPDEVQALVSAANQVAKLPYVYGGGHGGGEGRFVDSAYDCSGSVSFALASAGLLDSPLASGGFLKWGKPGKGKWITIWTNPGHMFMTVGGTRFDTVGLRQTGSRWQPALRSVRGMTPRHPPGL